MKKWFPLVIIIILSLICLWPFFKKGYFESHDGEWMVIRFSAFHQALTSGQFPVRFVDRLNNNYGYPVLNFLYPLPFYLAEIPKVLGFSFVDSIKIIFVVSTVTSSLAMYWALLQVFSARASLAGAIVYLFVPYRFVDLYVRGSLGESLAFAIIPLVAGCIFKIANGSKLFLPLLSISTASLILSHNVIAILFLPLFMIISLVFKKRERIKVVGSFILGILISTFFWLPALYDLRFVRLSQIDVSNIADHLVAPLNLVVPSWGYGPNPNDSSGLSVQFGIVTLAIFLSALYLRRKIKTNNLTVDISLVISLLIFFLMTKSSLFIWQNLPFIDVIQFPWRLLSLIVFISAFLAAYVITCAKGKKTVLSLLIISASIISTIVYTKPSAFVNRGEGFYSTNEDSTAVRDEYLPVWAQEKPANRANQKIEVIEGDAKIEQVIVKPSFYQASILASSESKIRVNTVYFPGWKVTIDNSQVPINYQNSLGLINFDLPVGEHTAIIKYKRSPVHLGSEIISLIALIATGIFFYFQWRKQNS
ncbi:MAG: hypothetical protein UU05_C0002G0017 [Candidatus Curtissbacteria bacterium GW2011_GWA1_40_47]|uniref:Membrane protein 6-pyruvoyl-tetrahydropterin synthase-related domain-containing protein n=1 Tax=Candidatus Curtissbacteria bacterium RIFOXYA1_FULL_41_14 TaxID=1797737 RepID=A0A1F5HAT8_9BACT|nr:MAG: hypothetical protein UT95_C0001G0018 [Candidatus Curtissbacteria bacterium GW2011_GWB1_40_28]KKR62304.1 MAG: hypothetical protein UU00_C0001G0024 [Microgenomates group bacterium GW2011_GWC1_40_35]KKR66306.1 MAG: hypothetical protein UU05_C0002G0017 [Candidatus Curtissbacteria bacterium GW2011_GWA1_40_47]KKR77408.1 MAG: hypothetical protein UU19_C0011G0002 [Candidatus Curtissbacteria bacterium GW2011_GWD1_40_8]KKS02472.1 MAG: hypothetical protein UU53_C0001G0017 [Candidatus Curtissbacter